jgi:DNA polymerase III subunit beta
MHSPYDGYDKRKSNRCSSTSLWDIGTGGGLPMKLRAERNEFVDTIAWATRTVGSRPTLPSLAGVHIDASENRLVARATDLELSAEISVEVQVDEPGTVLLPGRLLGQIAARLPEMPVEVEGSPDRVVISCGRARFSVRGMPVEDFPRIPEPDAEAASGVVEADRFVRLVSQVSRAASTDEARPILTGVKLEGDKEGLVAVATDSYRLARRRVAWEDGTDVEALVPARALTEAAKAAADAGGQVEIVFERGQVSFLLGDRRLQTTLVEGTYPDYRQLLPEASGSRVVADREELVEALQRVSVVALGQANTPVVLKFSDETLELNVDTQELGEASEAIPVELDGEGLQIAFNPVFLLSGFEGMETSQVLIELHDGLKPAVIRPHGEDADQDGIYLLMPVRTS